MHILPWEAAARVRLLLSQENLLDNGGELAPTLITAAQHIALISQIGLPPDTFLKVNMPGLGGYSCRISNGSREGLARTTH